MALSWEQGPRSDGQVEGETDCTRRSEAPRWRTESVSYICERQPYGLPPRSEGYPKRHSLAPTDTQEHRNTELILAQSGREDRIAQGQSSFGGVQHAQPRGSAFGEACEELASEVGEVAAGSRRDQCEDLRAQLRLVLADREQFRGFNSPWGTSSKVVH